MITPTHRNDWPSDEFAKSPFHSLPWPDATVIVFYRKLQAFPLSQGPQPSLPAPLAHPPPPARPFLSLPRSLLPSLLANLSTIGCALRGGVCRAGRVSLSGISRVTSASQPLGPAQLIGASAPPGKAHCSRPRPDHRHRRRRCLHPAIKTSGTPKGVDACYRPSQHQLPEPGSPPQLAPQIEFTVSVPAP